MQQRINYWNKMNKWWSVYSLWEYLQLRTIKAIKKSPWPKSSFPSLITNGSL